MVSVRIPTPLRKLSKDRGEVEIDAADVSELVDKLETECPGIKSRLCDDSGSLRRFINVYVNNEDIRFLEGMDTKLNDGAVVSIIPAIAGG